MTIIIHAFAISNLIYGQFNQLTIAVFHIAGGTRATSSQKQIDCPYRSPNTI